MTRAALLRARSLVLALATTAVPGSLAYCQAPERNGGAPVFVPASQMRVVAGSSQAAAETLLNPGDAAWEGAAPTKVILNRTPRIYQTEPAEPRPAPPLEVRALRVGNKLFVRLQWTDATQDAPEAPQKKTGEGGTAENLYKRPTGETSAFPDAAAVMMPEQWTGGSFPSVVMGDALHASRIYYWNASRGVQILRSTGRATQKPTGEAFNHQALYRNGKWAVVLEVPARQEGTPMAFAVWDGHHQDRDGLKFFSIWYALEGK